MNGTTTLQVPMTKTLRREAEVVASDYGFSSLQEVLRVFLTQFAARTVAFKLGEGDIQLSAAACRRYNKMLDDLKENRNFVTVSSIDELMKDLHAD